MSEELLTPFQIRNLRSSDSLRTTEDTLVRVSAPGYDDTLSSNPNASLKYRDEEGDKITVGLAFVSTALKHG